MPLHEQVSFAGDAAKLAGHLFLPDNTGADDAAPVAGVVVAGTWTSVKEQMADRYAAQLARRGFAALSFDFTGYGESAGEPRDFELPELKVARSPGGGRFPDRASGGERLTPGRIGRVRRRDVRERLRRRGSTGEVACPGGAVAARPPYLRGELRRPGGHRGEEGSGRRGPAPVRGDRRGRLRAGGQRQRPGRGHALRHRLLPQPAARRDPAVAEPVRRHGLDRVAGLRRRRDRAEGDRARAARAQRGRRHPGRRPPLPRQPRRARSSSCGPRALSSTSTTSHPRSASPRTRRPSTSPARCEHRTLHRFDRRPPRHVRVP